MSPSTLFGAVGTVAGRAAAGDPLARLCAWAGRELRDSVQRIERNHGEKLDEPKATVDAVSDGLQRLRRDLEAHGLLPPEEATG